MSKRSRKLVKRLDQRFNEIAGQLNELISRTTPSEQLAVSPSSSTVGSRLAAPMLAASTNAVTRPAPDLDDISYVHLALLHRHERSQFVLALIARAGLRGLNYQEICREAARLNLVLPPKSISRFVDILKKDHDIKWIGDRIVALSCHDRTSWWPGLLPASDTEQA